MMAVLRHHPDWNLRFSAAKVNFLPGPWNSPPGPLQKGPAAQILGKAAVFRHAVGVQKKPQMQVTFFLTRGLKIGYIIFL